MARKNSILPAKASARSASDARSELVARAGRNAEGATLCRSDPLADAQAARAIVQAVEEHAAELARRGLNGAYCEAALELARQIEDHLQAMPAAALSARGRSPDAAELLADAATTAQAVRTAVLRVTRGAEGRRVARDFGLGEPFSARQPAHVARALTRILAALETHREVRADIGLLPEDVQTMQDLARELETIAGAPATVSDEQAQLREAQGALRVFFDLFAAKTSLALAGDPDERARLLSLLPRAEERRHLRREPTRASG
jgi:hypothetical protein